MPETIKSLIIILALGSLMLHAHRSNLPKIISVTEFRQWQFLWFASSCAAFLSNNYWLFIIILLALLKSCIKGNAANKFTSYIWLLPVLPLLEKVVPGFGIVNYLFELSYPRLLSLAVLLPIFITHSNKKTAFLNMPGDKIFTLYLFISVIITTRNGDLSNILRSNFYLFIDVFLPYYVASRAFHQLEHFKKFAFAVFTVASILAIIALFESIRSWHLYTTLDYSFDITRRFSHYLFRDGVLRATGPFSSSIVLGYILTLGLGMGLAISSSYTNKKWYLLTLLLLVLALLSTASRGAWVGAIFLYAMFILLNHNKTKRIRQALTISIVFSPALFFTSVGQKIITLLPFIGKSNEGSIGYRQELFNQAMIVIQRQPLLGTNTYLETAEMQSMIQGQGIIDLVNTYIQIALHSGVVGVGLFILFFSGLVLRLFLAQRKIPKNEPETHQFAIALLATLLSVLVIIATVSHIDIISHCYWILAGITSSYLYFLKNKTVTRHKTL